METLINNSSIKKSKKSISVGYKRRVHEIHAPCQWLNDCYNGKCPAFVKVAGNYYCTSYEKP